MYPVIHARFALGILSKLFRGYKYALKQYIIAEQLALEVKDFYTAYIINRSTIRLLIGHRNYELALSAIRNSLIYIGKSNIKNKFDGIQELLMQAAWVSIHMEDVEQARKFSETFEQSEKTEYKSNEAVEAAIFMIRGRVLFHDGQYGEALKTLKKALVFYEKVDGRYGTLKQKISEIIARCESSELHSMGLQ